MADEQHIRWLLEGRDAWNARRRKERFTPDFSGADLFPKFRVERKLNAGGHIPLAGFDLRSANFAGAWFNTLASTRSADLSRALLHMADFRGARLPHARLSGAQLVGARLEGADLSSATLDDADFTGAILVGADLSWSRPWKARLFPEPDAVFDPSTSPPRWEITSVADLLEHCTSLRGEAPSQRRFYFRGEARNCWSLRPLVMRCKGGITPHRAHEGEMLLELMSRRPEDFASASAALDQWVLAQHHGLPTRLLDITRNPLVALLGASGGLDSKPDESACDGRVHVFSVPRELVKPFTSDTVAIISNLAKLPRSEQDCLLGWAPDDVEQEAPGASADLLFLTHERATHRLYHLVRQERPHFMESIEPRDYYQVFVVEPARSFERIRAQSGAFLISAFHERFEREEVLKWNTGIPVYDHSVLDVPNKHKDSIIRELSLLNVTRETLLPGLDEAARSITQQFSETPATGSASGDPDKSGNCA